VRWGFVNYDAILLGLPEVTTGLSLLPSASSQRCTFRAVFVILGLVEIPHRRSSPGAHCIRISTSLELTTTIRGAFRPDIFATSHRIIASCKIGAIPTNRSWLVGHSHSCHSWILTPTYPTAHLGQRRNFPQRVKSHRDLHLLHLDSKLRPAAGLLQAPNCFQICGSARGS
jgi:hypothetical protein